MVAVLRHALTSVRSVRIGCPSLVLLSESTD
jgi:hypothetical protein